MGTVQGAHKAADKEWKDKEHQASIAAHDAESDYERAKKQLVCALAVACE